MSRDVQKREEIDESSHVVAREFTPFRKCPHRGPRGSRNSVSMHPDVPPSIAAKCFVSALMHARKFEAPIGQQRALLEA
jgi:hypothetical protein